MKEIGAIFYRGPSLLTGAPIVGLVSGLERGSGNPKTGPAAQAWILVDGEAPMDAKRANRDDAICGDCQLRGEDGLDSGCYVAPWRGPHNVWKSHLAGKYLTPTWPELEAICEGRIIRLGAYGDPAAIPFEVWRTMLGQARGWIGYTHQWRGCDPRFKTLVMASTDTVDETHAARLAGWRTFRIRRRGDTLLPNEIICPASDEADHRTTCSACLLCAGQSRPARTIAILPHGKPSNLRVFRRL